MFFLFDQEHPTLLCVTFTLWFITGGRIASEYLLISMTALGDETIVSKLPAEYIGFDVLHDKLSSLLPHINSSLVRPEYKLKVDTSYALHSLHFHLTVHDLTKMQLSSLNVLSTCFLKSWFLLLPCATSVLYEPLFLNLYTISSLYSECHALSQATLALSPDALVRSALEFRIKLSSSYAKKKLSSVTQTNKLVSPILKSSSHLPPS